MRSKVHLSSLANGGDKSDNVYHEASKVKFHTVRPLFILSSNQCIKHETYEEFSRRVKKAPLNFPTDIIDNRIESLPKRIKLILKG